GLLPFDFGNRVIQKDARIAYLPQSGLTHKGRTLLEEVDTAFQFGYDLQKEIDSLGDAIQKNAENVNTLLEKQTSLITKLDESGWHRRNQVAETVLLGLGFSKADFTKNCETFSGGWQMRIALSKTLMQNPDILLLDEPTNYLDLEARTWLEQFLQNYHGAFLLVSHDRYFLDVCVTEIFELFNGQLKRYVGNFSKYEKIREVELQSLIKAYEEQQEEIARLEDFIRRFGAKATKASQAQDRQKQLDKIVRIEIPEHLKKIHFTFPKAPHSGRTVLRASGITKSYNGTENVLNNLELLIEKGERLVVVGKNGEGKSTLLRILSESDTDFSGEITLGTGVKVGYFSQESAELISGQISILDYMEDSCPLELIPKLRNMLGSFLFRGDDVFKSLDVLSGGEKSRLALLKLLLRPVNFLILDEPTNHLDMSAKDVLLSALKDFGGTVVFVSHDRFFIESLATRVLELNGGKYRLFPGNYQYYQNRLEAEKNGSVGEYSGNESSSMYVKNKKDVKAESAKNENSQKVQAQISWEEEKRVKAARRKSEKKIEKIEMLVQQKEDEKRLLEEKLALPEIYSDGEKCKIVRLQLESLISEIDSLTAKWEELTSLLG
ncbi:MAG: ABC-F family ATP-binding cassette domain-containing protein, partial [Treponema sp.]|nr:ABC-F family ATP-binding cassette domain-containing protein [Treponema sp.]